jgi:prevent-host-death family protein
VTGGKVSLARTPGASRPAERDRQPILITQHGVPSAILVDVATFESMQRRMSLLEGIARGERAIDEGRTVSHAEAKRRMGRWLK